jgi:hypothetical protein
VVRYEEVGAPTLKSASPRIEFWGICGIKKSRVVWGRGKVSGSKANVGKLLLDLWNWWRKQVTKSKWSYGVSSGFPSGSGVWEPVGIRTALPGRLPVHCPRTQGGIGVKLHFRSLNGSCWIVSDASGGIWMDVTEHWRLNCISVLRMPWWC